MRNHVVRFVVAGALALTAAPLTAPAHAGACTDLGRPVCEVYAAVCARIPAGGKNPVVHQLLCESTQ